MSEKPRVANQGTAKPRPSKAVLKNNSNSVGSAGSDRQLDTSPHQTGTPGRKTYPKLSH